MKKIIVVLTCLVVITLGCLPASAELVDPFPISRVKIYQYTPNGEPTWNYINFSNSSYMPDFYIFIEGDVEAEIHVQPHYEMVLVNAEVEMGVFDTYWSYADEDIAFRFANTNFYIIGGGVDVDESDDVTVIIVAETDYYDMLGQTDIFVADNSGWLSDQQIYDRGFNAGVNSVPVTDIRYEAFEAGHAAGRIEGRREGLIDGYENGFTEGRNAGFADGQSDGVESINGVVSVIHAIFTAPAYLIDSVLDFDIFGINIAGLVKSLITVGLVAVVAWIVVKIVKH